MQKAIRFLMGLPGHIHYAATTGRHFGRVPRSWWQVKFVFGYIRSDDPTLRAILRDRL